MKLRNDESFVEQLRLAVDREIASFIPEIHQLISDCMQATDAGPQILIVDSIEKIRGDYSVMESIRRLFAERTSALIFDSVHTIYTVPPYLPALEGGVLHMFNGLRQIGVTRCDSSPKGTYGRERLVEVVTRREPEWTQLLNQADLERVIEKSGGHLRMLFLLLEQIIVLAHARNSTLPVPIALLDEADAHVRRDFDALSMEDSTLLRRLLQTPKEFAVKDDEQRRFARLLDAGTVLTYLNGQMSFSVSPLAAEVVARSQALL
jgi:hypothetical protein